ncbi:hypothetical protein RvY_04335-3 [Ramazzottius varieornatus]|uniref:Peptidase M12A domain-containing protein n=1 Tax=Ramazzottius varieornatus TaxID=947166 RepID=A0A1D1URA6_RAMVA|nr:hypothetical protein RvY_04335-3 [Ramazzottius varieornatus]
MVRKRDLVVSMIYFALWLDVQVSAVKSADDFEDFRRRMTPFKTRVYNQNQQIKKWPNNKVYFYIDPGYTLQEEQLIRMSILRVVSDIHNCVIFVEVPASDPRYKVKITPFQNDGVTPESFCYTYPGVYAAGKASGALEQRAVLARGKSGCLDDGSIHRVMKFFGLLLGLRNVHQRPDRDNYIEIQRNYVLPGMLEFGYRKYSTEEALMVCPYDYCSITHNIEADFAANGPAFTVKQPPFFIPQLDRLSECDCQEISAGYGCNAKECSPLDCAAQVRPAMPPAVTQPPAPVPFSTQSSLTSVITSVTSSDKETTICYSVPNTQAPTEFSVKTTLSPTTLDRDASKTTCSIVAGHGTQCTTTFNPPTTTPMSANPCSLQDFCTKGPQESVGYFAAGYDKLLMFRGACAVEYTVDYERSKILPTSRVPNPQPTSQFFTGSKAGLLTNVDQAYVQVNVTDNSGNFQPQMVLISHNVAVLCVGLMPAACDTVLPQKAQGSSYSTWTNNGLDLDKRILYFVVNGMKTFVYTFKISLYSRLPRTNPLTRF